MKDYASVPVDYMAGAVERYIEHGIPPGHFLTAVICNDLHEAVARADENNQRALAEWVRWFCNEAPGLCWGSPEKFQIWLERFKKLSNVSRRLAGPR